MITARKIIFLTIVGLTLGVSGCQTSPPKDILKPDTQALQNRSMQSRMFKTSQEEKILAASAATLQDLGFTIDESETRLGVIVASKDADASDKTQVALATTAMVLGALGGTYDSRTYGELDDVQKVRASLVAQKNSSNTVSVRVTFQRIVWNKNKQISKMQTLNDEKLYQGFFEKLSKAVFLEDHQI